MLEVLNERFIYIVVDGLNTSCRLRSYETLFQLEQKTSLCETVRWQAPGRFRIEPGQGPEAVETCLSVYLGTFLPCRRYRIQILHIT